MKKITLFIAAILLAAGAFAQEKTTEEGLPYFNSIRATGKIEIVLSMDSASPMTMEVEYNGNDKNKVIWAVSKQGELAIKFFSNKKALPIRVTLNCHGLSTLTLIGASLTTADDYIWEEKIATVNLTSGGRFTGEVDITDLKLTATGGSVAIIKGSGRYATLEVHSKSTVDARDLGVGSVDLTTDGSGTESYVFGRDRIAIEATGTGKVFYVGTPDVLRIDAARPENVHQLN